jgi:transposase
MGKKRIIVLTDVQKKELEKGYKTGETHVFRQRCHIILLKSENRTSKEIAAIPSYPNLISVNTWVTWYEQQGFEGLKTKSGQGRKKILDPVSHTEIIKSIVQEERQRFTQAKALIEQALDLKMSKKTLTRFLKELAAPTNEFANGSKKNPTLHGTK